MAGDDPSVETLFPAEHRALRELFVTGRHLVGHWSALAPRLDGGAGVTLRLGVQAVTELLAELSRQPLPAAMSRPPAALSAGHRLAGLRNGLGDVFLERNQALRLALLDLQHVRTLLGYLAALGEQRGAAELVALYHRWDEVLGPIEDQARAAVIALAADPEAAVAPAAPSVAGRAGHRVALTFGAVGERIDRTFGGRV